MYALRQFMRMNGVKPAQIEEFVLAVSGKGLSVREVEQLAHGCFRGPESFRREILKGNLALPLERMRQVPQSSDGCNEFERVLLGDLELTQKYMPVSYTHLIKAGSISASFPTVGGGR